MKRAFTCLHILQNALCKIVLFPLLLLYISTAFADNTTYFMDGVNGNDINSGKSKNAAWKSLVKVNAITFEPGDRIYFKRGQVFGGYLYLKGSGAKGNPIKLGAFGAGRRPVINVANNECAVKLLDNEYWEITGIETKGGEKAGIFIGCTKDGLILNHIRIINCYVHDIGDTSKIGFEYSKSTGGIIAVNGTFDSAGKPVFYNSVLNDVIINDCTVRYNYRWTCISISSGKKNGKGGNANYIKNCLAEYSSADGIRMNGVRNSFIEYCVMYRNGAWPNFPGRNLGGLGAWFFDAENCTIQFCEASHVQAATTDGGAFDIDYWQKNSTVQYCYGHDCSGYGVSVFGADASFPTENSVVRYNVFSNNGRDTAFAFEGDIFVFTWNGGLLNGVKIYNNTSYWNPGGNAAALKFDADFTGNNPNIFKNNIIYSGHPWLDSMKNNLLQCDNNIYWVTSGKPLWCDGKNKYYSFEDWQKATGQDMHSKYINPMLNTPNYHGRGIPKKQFSLEPGSPAINAGVDVGSMGARDFFGNPIPDKSGKYDIGAFELAGDISNQKSKSEAESKAPGFELAAINNKKTRLTEFLGNTVLLSFINVDNPSEAGKLQANRSQLAFIKSMKKQYAEKGLKIILIDESSSVKSEKQDETLINFIEDHDLNDVVFLRDDKEKNIAEKYGVNVFPSTFLISKNGMIKERWENVALSSQLALAIEAQAGVSHFRKAAIKK